MDGKKTLDQRGINSRVKEITYVVPEICSKVERPKSYLKDHDQKDSQAPSASEASGTGSATTTAATPAQTRHNQSVQAK